MINLKKRFRNKAFCLAFASAVILLLQQIGLSNILPDNIMDIINTILSLLVMLGVVIDPTTKGIGDSEAVLQNINTDELINKNKEE